MSIASRSVAQERIKAATPESPIAVFDTRDGMDCVFADTIVARRRIAYNDGTHVGTFHQGSPWPEVYGVLRLWLK